MTTAPPDLLAVAEAVRRAAAVPLDDAPADLGGLLRSGGVPEHAVPALAHALDAVLGPEAVGELAADPWRLLAVPSVRPEQADAYARARLGGDTSAGDPRRSRALVTRLLERAAADGHTALPAATVLRALPALGVPDPDAALAAAVADGSALALDGPAAAGEPPPLLLALDRWAMAEDAVAEAVARLRATARHLCAAESVAEPAVRAAATAGVSVIVARTAAAAREALTGCDALASAAGVGMCVVAASPRAARGWRASGVLDASVAITTGPGVGVRVATAGLVVVPEAELLDVEAAAGVLEAACDGTHVVLVGDPGGLAGAGPGSVLADLTACGGVPHTVVRAGRGPAALDVLAEGVAAGALPSPDALGPGREVVVVPARSDAEAAHRVGQLVTDSIPRALGIAAPDIAVLSLGRDGPAGADALAERLLAALGPRPERGGAPGEPWALTLRAALDGRWPAVVLVLPASAAGSLGGDVLAAAVARAERHLSVVTAAGPALERAVASRPRRARVTRLRQLLADALGPPH